MSTMTVNATPPGYQERPLPSLPFEQDRGRNAMLLVIATEAFLFISLFFAYFFLGAGKDPWRFEVPPKLHYALIMLVILALSSVVLHWGEKQVKEHRDGAGRIALIATIVLGVIFFVLQIMEYREHWKTLTPTTDSYGSIFYTITSFHGLHLLVGLLILAYVLVLPHYSPTDESPYLPYKVGAMYWHFVDIVWFFIVGLLYVGPHL